MIQVNHHLMQQSRQLQQDASSSKPFDALLLHLLHSIYASIGRGFICFLPSSAVCHICPFCVQGLFTLAWTWPRPPSRTSLAPLNTRASRATTPLIGCIHPPTRAKPPAGPILGVKDQNNPPQNVAMMHPRSTAPKYHFPTTSISETLHIII